MERKALRELRRPKNASRLRPFVFEDERRYEAGIRGSGVERFRQTWTSNTERAALRMVETEEECWREGTGWKTELKWYYKIVQTVRNKHTFEEMRRIIA